MENPSGFDCLEVLLKHFHRHLLVSLPLPFTAQVYAWRTDLVSVFMYCRRGLATHNLLLEGGMVCSCSLFSVTFLVKKSHTTQAEAQPGKRMAAVGSTAGAVGVLSQSALRCNSSQYWLHFHPVLALCSTSAIQPCRDLNPLHAPAETKGEKPILHKCSGQEIQIFAGHHGDVFSLQALCTSLWSGAKILASYLLLSSNSELKN